MVQIGGLVSVGGGVAGGGGGSSSGITDINGQTGPSIVLVGTSGINILAQGNTIFIGGPTLPGCFTANFTLTTSGQFSHGLGTRDLVVQVFDDGQPRRLLVPDAIIYDTLDVFSVLFNRPQTGTVVALSCGGTTAEGTSNRVEIDLAFKAAFGNGDTYSEITRNPDGSISEINVWETNAMTSLLFTKTLTRVDDKLSQVSVTDHIAMSTLVIDLGRDVEGKISTITKVYTP